jgi:hypothetical protein
MLQVIGPVLEANEVVTDVDETGGARLGVEQGVEGGHAVGLGRWHGETL